MIEFNTALFLTLGNEGTYSNNTHDVGGETFMGIARNYNPDWTGWKIIDTLDKSKLKKCNILTEHPNLYCSMAAYYKEHYWNKILGNKLGDQWVANKLFDVAVNMGPPRAIKFLQESLNLLNKDGKLYQDLNVDGIIGNVTLTTLTSYRRFDPIRTLIKFITLLQAEHYINYIRKSSSQEEFARGWVNRLHIKINNLPE